MKYLLLLAVIFALVGSTLGSGEEHDDYGVPESTKKRCPATRTQYVQGTTTSTETWLITLVDPKTVYNATETLTAGTTTVSMVTVSFTATYTRPGETFPVYSTIYNASTTNQLPPQEQATEEIPNFVLPYCSAYDDGTYSVLDHYGCFCETSNVMGRITADHIYPYTTTFHSAYASSNYYYYTIVTEYHNTTCYAATATTTLPVFSTPRHFKLQVTDMPPGIRNRDRRYAEEVSWYAELEYFPGMSLNGNLTTGSVFNLTRIYNTTVLGRPGFNSTCGAVVYRYGYGTDVEHQADYIACTTNQSGGNDPRLLLRECYIDCLGILRCAVGEATEWYYDTSFDDPILPISLKQPVDEEDDVWIQDPGRYSFKVVPWEDG